MEPSPSSRSEKEKRPSLRVKLERIFVLSGLPVLIAIAIAAPIFALRLHSQERIELMRAQTHVISQLVAPAMAIYDFSDIQRLLTLVSSEQRFVPAVVTSQGDLLLVDYAGRARFEGTLRFLREKGGCGALSHGQAPPGVLPGLGASIFCEPIPKSSDSQAQAEGVSYVLVLVPPPDQVIPLGLSASFIGFAFFVSAVALLLFREQLRRGLVVPLERFVEWMDAQADDPFSRPSSLVESAPLLELERLHTTFANLLEKFRQAHEHAQSMQRQAVVGQLASQVAHDIRSPLAAIAVIEKNLDGLPEESRVLLRSAVNRMRDIANNLLDSNRKARVTANAFVSSDVPADPESIEGSIPGAGGEEPVSARLLLSIVESVVTEKRLQYRDWMAIEIEGPSEAEAYGLFSSVQPTELRRVLSNLIDNSVEACGERGSVQVGIKGDARHVTITVTDNGRGIPSELLPRLGRLGETYGKAQGSGLGLHHAMGALARWGGQLTIASALNKGTTVTLELPRCPTPSWFVSALTLEHQRPVVILDDDSSIHHAWQRRFETLATRETPILVEHFSTPAQLRNWVAENPELAKTGTFLLDQELIGHAETGLTLIQELGCARQAVLVTSRADEKPIIDACVHLGVRMIPKGLAAFVPLQTSGPASSPLRPGTFAETAQASAAGFCVSPNQASVSF